MMSQAGIISYYIPTALTLERGIQGSVHVYMLLLDDEHITCGIEEVQFAWSLVQYGNVFEWIRVECVGPG